MKALSDVMTDLGMRSGPQRSSDPNRGGRMTKWGWFSDADLGQADARGQANGVLVFPIRYENVGFDPETGKVIQNPIYPPLGIENAEKRREMAEHDGHTVEARWERYREERKQFEKQRGVGPRRGA